MSAQPCPRLFEAEAMRDGRLGDAERASFARHAKACPACTREVEALAQLARSLRATDAGQPDELQVRRERTRLLAAFNRELLVPERRPGGRLVWAVVAAPLVGALAVIWHLRAPSPGELASSAVVRAEEDAAWSERSSGDREEVLLERGSLRIHVDHGSVRRRLVVILPDGELEDTGTTFTVSASSGRTTRVSVEEGSVVIRLRAGPVVTVRAGETWTPRVAAPAACAAVPPPSASPSTAPSPGAPPARASSPLPAATATDGSLDYRAAMAALDRGDNREAAAGFAGFLAKHPRDPRAEDAAYLRVIAFDRCGDRDAVKGASLDYLSQFPAGFRRAEVERLSRGHLAVAP
jgi:hypothetical protein